MEMAIQIICVLILAAFILRVIIGSFKIIYKVAPFIVISIITIILMLWFVDQKSVTDVVTKLKDQNATITRTVENKG